HTRSYGDWSSDVCSSDLNAKSSDGMHIQIRSTRPVQSKTLREAAASGPDTPESALKPAKRRKKLQSRHSRTALSAPRSATSRMLLPQHPCIHLLTLESRIAASVAPIPVQGVCHSGRKCAHSG